MILLHPMVKMIKKNRGIYMKRVATAMGNPTLNQELKRYTQMEVVGEDLFYQDAVIDFVEKENIEVLALSGILQGQWDLLEFVDRIQKKNSVLRLVIVLDEMDTNLKCDLLERDVKDIFLDETVEVKDIVEAICREEPIRMKLEKEIMKEKIEATEEDFPKVMVSQKQEIIAVCGNSGSGKSTFLYQLSKQMAKKTNSKILVMDMNTLCGNLEERYGINKIPQNVEILLDEDKKCGLNYAADLIKKGRFDANVLEEIVINKEGVDILTGNTSLYYCQEVLNTSIYQSIVQCAKEKYDFILMDTSSNIFLDSTKWCIENATKVLFVMDNDEISLKKSEQMLEIMTKNWGVWKNKIQIIINKERAGFMDLEVLSHIFNEYQLVGRIKQNGEKEEAAYDQILESIHFVPKTSLWQKVIQVKKQMKESFLKETKQSFSKVRSDLHHAH